MSSPEERLVAALRDSTDLALALGHAVPGRLFARSAPAGLGPPLIVWQVAPSSFEADLDGGALMSRAIQIDIYAESYKQVAQIARAIRGMVHRTVWLDDGEPGAILAASVQGETDSLDEQSGVSRRIIDLRLLARD
jgi:hypothetical protein